VTGSGRYFFLSYPRLPPLPAVPGVDLADPPDDWARAFFDDLTAAVRARADPASGLCPGFLDSGLRADSAAKLALRDALGSAEVFVPLLSPEYLRRSWPGREWASFEQRMLEAGGADASIRIAPVLWVPLPAGEHPPGLAEALSLVHGAAAAPYAENGLRALQRLDPYHARYEQVVAALADRVVALAERTPVGPSLAPDPERVDGPFRPAGAGRVFAVAVATPAGPTGIDRGWRPFGPGQAAPLTEYALLAVEKLGFAVRLLEFEKSVDVLRRTPGIVLVNPALAVAGPAGAAEDFRTLMAELPSWVLPLIVVDQEDAHNVQEMMIFLDKTYKAYKSRPNAVRRGLRGVRSLREFLAIVPFLVTQAEREYLRHDPIARSAPGAPPRPHPSAGGRPPIRPVEENPDV
jgi:hypothetical protein